MTLRFRNRFTADSCVIRECPCGLRVAHTVNDGRETVIHELPWCPTFRALMGVVADSPDAALHMALVAPELGEMMVTADGDTLADVEKGQ